jgi:NAD(P)-dependent dehydrogenase (short-subunit alcohol dehydrogenase family)
MRRVALLTGVAGGIGRATAAAFQEAGWYVVGVDRDDASIDAADRFVKADVSSAEAWERIASIVDSDAGRIDALINNAAVQICKPIVEMTPDEWDATMRTNLRSAFLAVRSTHDLFQDEGAIVNVSSVHAVATSANIGAYAASKGGLLAFTRSLALELAEDGIRANAVLPGAVDTDMLRDGLQRGHVGEGESVDDQVHALGKRHVTGRVGRPAEIAETILFLADPDRSSFVTGQALTVDGGATARLSTE